MTLGSMVQFFKDHPVAATLEYGTVAACVFLFVATVVAIAQAPVSDSDGLFLVVIGVGTAVVLLWTVIVPIYQRFTHA